MIADLQDRLTIVETNIRALRSWIIVGTIASIVGTILKLLPLQTIHAPQETAPPPASNTNSLHIGTNAEPPGPESRAIWLTTDDVARREKKSPRTILNWITEGRILPAPIQTERAWLISPDYTIIPLIAADGGN